MFILKCLIIYRMRSRGYGKSIDPRYLRRVVRGDGLPAVGRFFADFFPVRSGAVV